MRRLALVVAVALLGVLVLPAAQAAPVPPSFTKHTQPEGAAYPSRDYWLYLPTVDDTAPTPLRPLVVYLHGCTQNGPDAAVGTRWNEQAEKAGFVVAYPEQPASANGTQCWNWFLPDHQSRDKGEPAALAAITRSVIDANRIDPTRVYVIGASAGADMATILAATYPDLYAALGAFGGCPYLTCGDVTGKLAHTAMGPRTRVMPTFVVQGSIDALNNVAMGEALAAQWAGTNDLADDGVANRSVSPVPSSREHYGVDQSALAGVGTVGDTCARNKQFPCAGALLGLKSYPYTVEHHADASGCSVVDLWLVHGLGHDYPGGNPAGSFTDPIGPDVTGAAWKFFSANRIGSPACLG